MPRALRSRYKSIIVIFPCCVYRTCPLSMIPDVIVVVSGLPIETNLFLSRPISTCLTSFFCRRVRRERVRREICFFQYFTTIEMNFLFLGDKHVPGIVILIQCFKCCWWQLLYCEYHNIEVRIQDQKWILWLLIASSLSMGLACFDLVWIGIFCICPVFTYQYG